MIDELGKLPAPDGRDGSLMDAIDLIVPHQANKTMVIGLAERAGLTADQLYFNIEKVGNTSSRSEEHTSELQSRQYLVCRLLLEKKKKKKDYNDTIMSYSY